MSERLLVYYTGAHLGPRPRTVLRASDRHVTWDTPVKSLPAADAADLLAAPASFCPAEPLEAAARRFGIAAKRLAKLGAAGSIHVETFQPRGAEEATAVVVLDELTAAGVAEERAAIKAAAEKAAAEKAAKPRKGKEG